MPVAFSHWKEYTILCICFNIVCLLIYAAIPGSDVDHIIVPENSGVFVPPNNDRLILMMGGAPNDQNLLRFLCLSGNTLDPFDV